MMSDKASHFTIVLSFLLVSLFLTIGRVGTAFNSFALLTPDLGVYASIAAGQDHPDLFVEDPFLSSEKNTNSYNMVFIPVVKALSKLFGNYGTACVFLLPFVIFIHLTGYYLLGISIFKKPWIGLLVSLLLSAPTTTALDFWGLTLDALPRFIYQSLIPFVLVLSIRFGRDPKWWPVILGGVGVLNYVHPLSTPPWAAAVMLALWVSAPALSPSEKFRKMAMAGMVLVLILSPFIVNYIRSTVIETSQVIHYDQTMSILRSHISTMGGNIFLDPLLLFFSGRVNRGFDIIWLITWGCGVGGILWGLSTDHEDLEKGLYLRQITAWMLGIFLVGGLLPALERIIFAYLRRIPPEFEILRTLRYLAPLIVLATLYTFWLAVDMLKRKGLLVPTTAKYIFAGTGISLLLLWGLRGDHYRAEFRDAVRQNITCWMQGQVICDLPAQSMDFINIMNVIYEKTPIGSSIFSEGQEVAIRYYALRPLAFTYKDGAPLAYTDTQGLLTWSKTYEEMDQLAFIRKFPFRRKRFVNGILDVAQTNHADYLLLQEPFNTDMYIPAGLDLVYTNSHYSLFEINEK